MRNEAAHRSEPDGLRERVHRVIRYVEDLHHPISRARLAELFDCHRRHVFPTSGNIKLQRLRGLHELTGWSYDQLVSFLCEDDTSPGDVEDDDYAELDTAALEAYRTGRFREMITLGRRMELAAGTADEHARACLRQGGGAMGLGRYEQAAAALRRGREIAGVSATTRTKLDNSYVAALAASWDLMPALGLADRLIRRLNAPDTPEGHRSLAYARYIKAKVVARLVSFHPGEVGVQEIRETIDGLRQARDVFAAGGDDEHTASMCRSTLTELLAQSDAIDPELAIDELAMGLERSGDPSLDGMALTAIAWQAISGARIARNKLAGDRRGEQIALFEEHVLAVADQLDAWDLRLEIAAIEYRHRLGGERVILDEEDRRLIIGLIGRFPGAFGRLGMTLLERAEHVGPMDSMQDQMA